MEDLVELVSQQTGLPKDVARKAVEVVLNYLKKGFPTPIEDHVHIDTLMKLGRWGAQPTQQKEIEDA